MENDDDVKQITRRVEFHRETIFIGAFFGTEIDALWYLECLVISGKT